MKQNFPKDSLIYSLNERPPYNIIILSAMQHIIAMFPGLIICPLIVAKATHLDTNTTINFISISIIFSAIGILLQAFRPLNLGSGYLCIIGSSGSFIANSISAGLEGGISLICGMTFFTAPIKIFLSYLASRLHNIVPTYFRGVLIIIIAISILKISLTELTGTLNTVSKDIFLNISIGSSVIISTLIATRGKFYFRISSILIGIITGCIFAFTTNSYQLPDLRNVPLWTFPDFFYTNLSFSWKQFLPFCITYFIITLETLGDAYTLIEVSTRTTPKKTLSIKRIQGTISSSAFASLLSGASGGMALTTYSGNIAIIKITGISSKIVAISTGVLLFLPALSPKFTKILAELPHSIIGGSMLIALIFMLQIGYNIIKREAKTKEKHLSYFVAIIALILTFFPNTIPQYLPYREIIQNPISSCTLLLLLIHIFSQCFTKHKKTM